MLIDDQDALKCPQCGEVNLHQFGVLVHDRMKEDGPAIRTEARGDTVHVVSVEAENVPGRRDCLEIFFWCEHCHEPETIDETFSLFVQQHKGTTYLTWGAPLA
jgi:hypothetical protein